MPLQSVLMSVSIDDMCGRNLLPVLRAGHLLPLTLLVLLLALYHRAARRDFRDDFPALNSPRWYESKIVKQLRFLSNGIEELAKARCLSKGNPFRLLTNSREIVVLPPSYADILVNEERLSFAKYFADVCAPRLSSLPPSLTFCCSFSLFSFLLSNILRCVTFLLTMSVGIRWRWKNAWS